MEVNIIDSQSILSINPAIVEALARQVVANENREYDEVTINFIEMDEMCRLHDEFFDDPSPTDCISFPMDDEEDFGYRVLGEIFVAPKAAIDYVKDNGGDPLEETTLYVVHGLLHLMGYDDIETKDREKMRAAEKRQLDFLKAEGLCLK